MKNIGWATLLFLASCGFVATAQAVEPSTKFVFAKGSYCGSFTGNLKQGKRFRLWLLPDQELVIRNIGEGQIRVAYVEAPNGRLSGTRYNNATTYYTARRGNHYIKIYGSNYHSSVEFCAY